VAQLDIRPLAGAAKDFKPSGVSRPPVRILRKDDHGFRDRLDGPENPLCVDPSISRARRGLRETPRSHRLASPRAVRQTRIALLQIAIQKPNIKNI